MKFKHVFQGLWDRFSNGHAAQAEPQAAAPALSDTERQIEEAIEQLKQRVVVFKKAHNVASVKEYTAEELAERAEAELNANAEKLMSSIRQEHAKLETGLTDERLAVVVARMRTMAERNAIVPKTLPERLAVGVRKKALEACGLLAWDALEKTMERHGARWPDPSGLGHAPTAEQIEHARRLEAAHSRNGFLGTRPSDVADLAQGYVRVWKSIYPDSQSNLWRETVLQGVGAGLWCFYAAVAQALFLKNREALEAKANEVLSSGLGKLSELLKAGGEIDTTLQTNVTFRAQEIVADVIPDLVWSEISSGVASAEVGADTDKLLADTESGGES